MDLVEQELFNEEETIKEEVEKEAEEFLAPRIKNPTTDMNPKNYPKGFKVNGNQERCSCGKIIQEYYQIILARKAKQKKNGEYILNKSGKKSYYSEKQWHYFTYPEAYCHCKCGKQWKKHY